MFVQKEKMIIWQAIFLKSIEERHANNEITFMKRMQLIKEINACFEEEQNEFLSHFEKFLKKTPELSDFLLPLINYIIKNKLGNL